MPSVAFVGVELGEGVFSGLGCANDTRVFHAPACGMLSIQAKQIDAFLVQATARLLIFLRLRRTSRHCGSQKVMAATKPDLIGI